MSHNKRVFSYRTRTFVSANIPPTAVVLPVAVGGNFIPLGVNDYEIIKIFFSGAPNEYELVKVLDRSNPSAWLVERGVFGTTARTWAVGTSVEPVVLELEWYLWQNTFLSLWRNIISGYFYNVKDYFEYQILPSSSGSSLRISSQNILWPLSNYNKYSYSYLYATQFKKYYVNTPYLCNLYLKTIVDKPIFIKFIDYNNYGLTDLSYIANLHTLHIVYGKLVEASCFSFLIGVKEDYNTYAFFKHNITTLINHLIDDNIVFVVLKVFIDIEPSLFWGQFPSNYNTSFYFNLIVDNTIKGTFIVNKNQPFINQIITEPFIIFNFTEIFLATDTTIPINIVASGKYNLYMNLSFVGFFMRN